MDTRNATTSAVITRRHWDKLSADFKTGSPEAGTAMILRWIQGSGTCLVPVEVVDREHLFHVGALVVTPGSFCRLGVDVVARVLARHKAGEWGDLTDEDQMANAAALRTGARLLSSYNVGHTSEVRVWVITEAETGEPAASPGQPRPRGGTTVLLPSEY